MPVDEGVRVIPWALRGRFAEGIGAAMVTRREVMSEAGYVALLLVPVVVGCGSSSSASNGCDGLGSTSSVVQGHSHTVCIPSADLMTPPQGGATYTTSGPDPTHTITLSAAQLSAIEQ